MMHSCVDQKESGDKYQSKMDINGSFEPFVMESEAIKIAENLNFSPMNMDKANKLNSKREVQKSPREVKSILGVPDENNIAAFYIINYKNGGFVILAGDRRSKPILAFSETHHFKLNAQYYPSGLVGWLYGMKEKMERIREENAEFDEGIRQLWSHLGNKNAYIVPSNREPDIGEVCTRTSSPRSIQKGPFLSTSWGQSCGYNSLLPQMDCHPDDCSRAFTGCLATAMAQVMKYYQYPKSYDWSNMPNTYGTHSTAVLMRDIGIAVRMKYKCSGSGADIEDEGVSSFRNDFGYSSASFSGYDCEKVKRELDNNSPVILRGGRKSGWWIFSQYKDGHAWVCDGYLEIIYPCWVTTLHLHMNWGWGGRCNGWYAFNDFNPGKYTFNYKRKMIYNIEP